MDEVLHPEWAWWMPESEKNRKAFERACAVWLIAFYDPTLSPGDNPTEYDVSEAEKLYKKLIRLNLAYYRHQESRANGLRTELEREAHEKEGERIERRIAALDDKLERYGLHIYRGDMYLGLAYEDDNHFADIVL